MKRLFLIVSMMIILTAPAGFAMEKPFSVHLYPFAGGWIGGDWLKYDYLGQSSLYGGRLGFAVGPYFTVEGGYEFAANEFQKGERLDETGDVDITMYYGDVLAHVYNSKKFSPYFLFGWGKMEFDTDVESASSSEQMVMLGGGLIYYFMENVGVRAEVREVITDPSPDNILVTAGLEMRFLGKWPKKPEKPLDLPDTDGDGVWNKKDRCPGTPAGAQVDAGGCPIDTDGDGVYDGLDRCPGTPPGVKVGASGCAGDSDGDGVTDDADKCPGTPVGVKVDTAGCPIDGDGDTVPDGLDDCPMTPKGEKVDERGCTLDTDGDTVPDSKDACPGTPTGTPVDITGCPEASGRGDSDGDTVPDGQDRCPNTTPGVEVDEMGCQVITERLVLAGITFGSGSSRIQPGSFKELDSVVEVLRAHPEIKIEIQGYTDNRGSVASNMRLSQRRARSVYNYLRRAGIAVSRLSYKGYGPENPIATNDTLEGRAKNRRIEFKVLD